MVTIPPQTQTRVSAEDENARRRASTVLCAAQRLGLPVDNGYGVIVLSGEATVSGEEALLS